MKETESYYKILGTTANISNRRIKEKYIQAVKNHPPERDPEGFEKVRRAYETLKDPEKRKQYDLMRKYGGNVEEIMEKALDAMDQRDFAQAEKLFDTVNKMAPDNQSVLIGQMTLATMTDNLAEGEKLFEKVLDILTDTEDVASLYMLKTRTLYDQGYEAEALETLEQAMERLPERQEIAIPAALIYMNTGYYDEALETIESVIPDPGEETAADIQLFTIWTEIITQMDKWELISKVQARFRKLLKTLTDEEDIDEAYEWLYDEFASAFDAGDFRTATVFGDLLKVIDKLDKDILDEFNKAKKLAQLQKQLTRLEQDESMFPLIYIDALQWFYENYMPEEELSMILRSLPQDMIDALKEEQEEYAAGIVRLQKKYAPLYKAFKEDWDNLFADLTKDFNRETRRDIRKAK